MVSHLKRQSFGPVPDSDKIFGMHDSTPQRREILGALIGASLATSLPSPGQTRSGDMIYRTLGRTGERVSAIGLGGYHMAVPKDEQDGIKLVRTAVDSGINFLDNCWDYHDGKSEVWMGKALRDGYRHKVFLMTKFDGRTKQSTARQIDESLQRLQTDHVDLMRTTRTSAWKIPTASSRRTVRWRL